MYEYVYLVKLNGRGAGPGKNGGDGNCIYESLDNNSLERRQMRHTHKERR